MLSAANLRSHTLECFNRIEFIMSIRVLSFDPLQPTEVDQFEQDLDFYLGDGWDVLTTVSGNRSGVMQSASAFRSGKTHSPQFRDYVVFVLRKSEPEQRSQ